MLCRYVVLDISLGKGYILSLKILGSEYTKNIFLGTWVVGSRLVLAGCSFSKKNHWVGFLFWKKNLDQASYQYQYVKN
jgi:hypothetical protein